MTFTTRSPWEVAADLLAPVDDSWEPLPHQIPPPGNWFGWLLLGGRGAGKTATAARYVHDHVHGPPCLPGVPGGHWIGIIGPTLGDAATSCVYGPSGLRVHDPGVRIKQTAGGATVRWTNGAEAKLFGAHTPEDVERLRSGGNRCLIWAEELAAWRYLNECWQHMRYGLRVGPWPHWIASTTPKPKKLIKELKQKAITGVLRSNGHPEVVMTSATTKDNPHLDDEVKKQLFEDYGGTRLGRQELYAEILDDVPNALWLPPFIDETRIDMAVLPHLDVIVVGVDPPAKETGAECGIIVSGKVDRWDLPVQRELGLHDRSHGFVLDDRSKAGRPDEWAKAVISAFDDWKANRVVVEVNNGGDMVKHTLRQIRQSLPVKEVHASRGKAKRAEPVATLYEQRRMHHLGYFPHLEDQQLTFDPDEPDPEPSPDRMDACVWGFTDLMVSHSSVVQSQTRDDRLRGRR